MYRDKFLYKGKLYTVKAKKKENETEYKFYFNDKKVVNPEKLKILYRHYKVLLKKRACYTGFVFAVGSSVFLSGGILKHFQNTPKESSSRYETFIEQEATKKKEDYQKIYQNTYYLVDTIDKQAKQYYKTHPEKTSFFEACFLDKAFCATILQEIQNTKYSLQFLDKLTTYDETIRNVCKNPQYLTELLYPTYNSNIYSEDAFYYFSDILWYQFQCDIGKIKNVSRVSMDFGSSCKEAVKVECELVNAYDFFLENQMEEYLENSKANSFIHASIYLYYNLSGSLMKITIAGMKDGELMSYNYDLYEAFKEGLEMNSFLGDDEIDYFLKEQNLDNKIMQVEGYDVYSFYAKIRDSKSALEIKEIINGKTKKKTIGGIV